MAKAPAPFHEFVMELFAPMGPVNVRRMFGGAGVFRDGLMFALLSDYVIYLKTDAALRARDRQVEQRVEAFQEVAGKVRENLVRGAFDQALLDIASLKGPVDRFFDDVMVMAEEMAAHKDIRPLRIALLNLMPKKIQTENNYCKLFYGTKA